MMSLGGRSRPELSFPRPRAANPGMGLASSVSPAAETPQPTSQSNLGPWGNFFRLAWCWTGYFGSTRQAPQRFSPAEGAEPECGRVGVCMSVDPERHTLTHTHSHARTHAGPSAATLAPPGTLTQGRSSVSCALCQAPADSGNRTSSDGRVSPPPRGGCPRIPPPPPPPSARPGKGMTARGTQGSYRSGSRVRAGAPAGSRPATSARLAGTRPEGGPGGGRVLMSRAAPPRGPDRAPPPVTPPQPRARRKLRAPPSSGCGGRGRASDQAWGTWLFWLCASG